MQNGFIAVSKSAHLIQKLKFNTVLVDEAHHPLPPKLPKTKELFQFSATLEQEEGIDFQYTMGKAIEDRVLCDYDITVPAVTAHHAYICLADLLLKQAGRFRRVLAYCNSVAEAKRFQMVLEELGLGAWHINAATGWKERKRVMDEFTGVLKNTCSCTCHGGGVRRRHQYPKCRHMHVCRASKQLQEYHSSR